VPAASAASTVAVAVVIIMVIIIVVVAGTAVAATIVVTRAAAVAVIVVIVVMVTGAAVAATRVTRATAVTVIVVIMVAGATVTSRMRRFGAAPVDATVRPALAPVVLEMPEPVDLGAGAPVAAVQLEVLTGLALELAVIIRPAQYCGRREIQPIGLDPDVRVGVELPLVKRHRNRPGQGPLGDLEGEAALEAESTALRPHLRGRRTTIATAPKGQR
jgi:hypothetical protein